MDPTRAIRRLREQIEVETVKKNLSESSMRANRESGFITFDFIFALLLALGFTTVLFAISVTLSAVEVAQYITFAVSRAYVGAHEDNKMQEELAMKKYEEEMALPAFKAAFNGGWFSLGKAEVGDFNKDYAQYNQGSGIDNDTFIGARIPMDAKILRMQIPFLGKTSEKSTTGKATLNSYLMREVTNTECRENFNRSRYAKLKALGPYTGAPNTQAKLITDNGC